MNSMTVLTITISVSIYSLVNILHVRQAIRLSLWTFIHIYVHYLAANSFPTNDLDF